MSDIVQAFGLPPARDFLMSPGLAGVAALIAAVIVVCAVLYGSRRAGKRHLADSDQRERHHEERRADEQHAVAVARCWDRWWQVLQTAALEPAASEGTTLGLGPEVTLQVLRGLLRDAEQLADDTLVKAITVYQEQLLLVLAQQSGPLSRLATETATPVNGGSTASPSRDTPRSIDSPGPASAPGRRTTPPTASPASESESDEITTAATEKTSGRRRRQ